MTLNQLREATVGSLADGLLEPEECKGILAAIDRQATGTKRSRTHGFSPTPCH
jgi:hypothetical protein